MTRLRRIGYNLNVMRQCASLVFNPIMIDNCATFFNCTPEGQASDYMIAQSLSYHFSWLWLELFVCCLAHLGSTGDFLLFAP